MSVKINDIGGIHHSERGNVSPEYRAWLHLRERCNNANDSAYEYYGGRGIKVCERWNSFANFLVDMGNRPEGMTIDRINVDGDYEPSNCRWTSYDQQAQNRRSTKLTWEDAVNICIKKLQGVEGTILAEEYNVQPPLISKIWLEQRWFGAKEEALKRLSNV